VVQFRSGLGSSRFRTGLQQLYAFKINGELHHFHPSYSTLHYTMPFPRGEEGYHTEIPLNVEGVQLAGASMSARDVIMLSASEEAWRATCSFDGWQVVSTVCGGCMGFYRAE
jgi:hypothetical protein